MPQTGFETWKERTAPRICFCAVPGHSQQQSLQFPKFRFPVVQHTWTHTDDCVVCAMAEAPCTIFLACTSPRRALATQAAISGRLCPNFRLQNKKKRCQTAKMLGITRTMMSPRAGLQLPNSLVWDVRTQNCQIRLMDGPALD